MTKKAKSGKIFNEKLAEESDKPVIKKLERIRVYARFKDDIWATDLVEM